MEERLLPLGSAVKTVFSTYPLLIAGYYPVDIKRKKVSKYVAVDCALGFGADGKAIMIDDADIADVVSEGYTNERGDEFRSNIYLMYEQGGLKDIALQTLAQQEKKEG